MTTTYQVHDLHNCRRFQLGRGPLGAQLHRLRNRMHEVRAAGPERLAEELAPRWDAGTRSPSPPDPYVQDLARRIYTFCEDAQWNIYVTSPDVGSVFRFDWPIVDSRYLDDPECKAANAQHALTRVLRYNAAVNAAVVEILAEPAEPAAVPEPILIVVLQNSIGGLGYLDRIHEADNLEYARGYCEGVNELGDNEYVAAYIWADLRERIPAKDAARIQEQIEQHRRRAAEAVIKG